ncbi:MAG TPA: OmpH family outer membrane protein [Smithellaceae bacterium]|jgi:outer membrane protein|nr:OmpH family outer membrane protein [Syntrophaceae bacterium]HOE79766.1 OmpH family outer membrane protein [Smithellaceae bacterium]HPL96860.1 OmpH family outer membrane protein [Smithellaceae bacterium]HPV48319.1 OmpH family outer membrane protein [Smithellaceae bacterium]HQF84699.1 OmpH family outer membrane protein [Smithellaceae bacterium]
MRKTIYLFAGLMLFVFGWAGASFGADKIGFFNMHQVIQGSNAGKKAADEFKAFYDKKQAAIKAMETEITKMKEELEKQGAVMTPAARSDKELAYQRKMRDYQILVDDTNKEYQRRDQEYSAKMMPEILKVVRTIGEKEKYSLIIDYSSVPLPYHDKSADITNKIIEEYNKSAAGKK